MPYTVRLVASNHVGQSPQSDPLLFTTLDEGQSLLDNLEMLISMSFIIFVVTF